MEEHAKQTRQALHGSKWPSSNPKLLWVDFASKEEVKSHMLNIVIFWFYKEYIIVMVKSR